MNPEDIQDDIRTLEVMMGSGLPEVPKAVPADPSTLPQGQGPTDGEMQHWLKLMRAALTQLEWDYGTLREHYTSKPAVIEPLREAIARSAIAAAMKGEGK